MKYKKLVPVSLALLALTSAAPASAATMRCGTHLIEGGMRDGPDKYEVLKRCGEPAQRGTFNWVYKLPNGSTRTLIFDHSGRLSRIEQN